MSENNKEKKCSKPKKLPFRIGIVILTSLIALPMISIIHLKCVIPNEITISAGSNFSYELLPFTCVNQKGEPAKQSSAKDGLISTDGNTVNFNTNNVCNYSMSVNLFDTIPVKDISVSVKPQKYVIAGGSPIGIKLYTDGVFVVGMSYVTTPDGKNVYPAKDAGLKNGDIITAVNDNKISSVEEMTKLICSTDGTFTLSINRDNEIMTKTVHAVQSSDGQGYKIGIWVRDSAAGVGTLTFYDPDTNKYAALGHAITDVDTGKILNVKKGSILSCNILSVTKGVRGTPGELVGGFTDNTLGDISLNSPFGIYGNMTNTDGFNNTEKTAVATRFQIQEGDAYILADVDGGGIKQYTIKITKISKDNSNNKGIVFKVTDNSLLDKTGGIVQGMSGCPIIQNNMLVGAVTHVFVNEPTKGYGIFAENMIDIIYNLF